MPRPRQVTKMEDCGVGTGIHTMTFCKKEVARAQSLHETYVSFILNQAKHLQIKLSEKQHHYSAKQHCFVGMLARQAHKCVVAK